MMRVFFGRALVALGCMGITLGVYLSVGTVAALIFGSFVVYVAGYHLTLRKRADSAQARHEEASIRVSTSIQEVRQAAQRRGMN